MLRKGVAQMNLNHSLGRLNLAVILLTLVLFIAALFFKGITHDILLEIGIFLVSVKLILATHQILRKLDELKKK